MPNQMIKKDAKRFNIDSKKIEEIWNQAKDLTQKENKNNNFAYITKIYKNILNNKYKGNL